MESSEIILSLGVATASEARRISAKLWLQTEALFAMVRTNPALDAAAIRRITAATVRGFSDLAADELAGVDPMPMENALDEPVNIAARMGGLGLAAKYALDRCDVDAALPQGQRLGQALLGGNVAFDRRESRRLARAVFEGIKEGALAAEPAFAQIGHCRRAAAIAMDEFAPRVDDSVIPAVLALKVGDRIGDLLVEQDDDRNPAEGLSTEASTRSAADWSEHQCGTPVLVDAVEPLRSCLAATAPAPLSLAKAHWTLSRMWADYAKYQVENRHWNADEAASSIGTLKMMIHILTDRPLCQYTADNMCKFRRIYRQLPSKYAQQQPWRDLYEKQGPFAVIEAAKGVDTPRIHDKTWNKIYSRISPLYDYACTQQGAALRPGTANIMEGLFVKIARSQRTPAQVREDWRLYSADELVKLLTAPRFLGCTSGSRWGVAGSLVFRDARYWLTIIGFLHGNRREEPLVLKVKHIKKCPVSGIWYFNWRAKELAPLLKDSGSPRDVPLHHKLLDLGFLDARVFDRDPEDEVFPDTGSDAEIGGEAGPFGSWFGRLRRSCGLLDAGLDFHAARHTVIVQLNHLNYSDSLIEAIVGHESLGRRSSIESYKHPLRLMTLKPIVDAIDMPLDVDLMKAAVARSDALDPKAAWPDLAAPRKWRQRRR